MDREQVQAGPLDECRLQKIEQRERMATPGPWVWYGYKTSRQIYLVAVKGFLVVMDFVRWGMQSACARFRDERDLMQRADSLALTHGVHERVTGVCHPDAEFIRHARQDVPDLLEEVRRLQRETSRQVGPLLRVAQLLRQDLDGRTLVSLRNEVIQVMDEHLDVFAEGRTQDGSAEAMIYNLAEWVHVLATSLLHVLVISQEAREALAGTIVKAPAGPVSEEC